MKYLTLAALALLYSIAGKSQNTGEPKWPPENLRPDTITSYLFTGHTVCAATIPAKAVSDFGLHTNKFDLLWMPVYTRNADELIKRSTRHLEKYKVSDTLHCTLFGESNVTIVLVNRSKAIVMIYRKESTYQDVFMITKLKTRQVGAAIDFIETYLGGEVKN